MVSVQFRVSSLLQVRLCLSWFLTFPTASGKQKPSSAGVSASPCRGDLLDDLPCEPVQGSTNSFGVSLLASSPLLQLTGVRSADLSGK